MSATQFCDILRVNRVVETAYGQELSLGAAGAVILTIRGTRPLDVHVGDCVHVSLAKVANETTTVTMAAQ